MDDYNDEPELATVCPLCGGLGVLLGVLGTVTWLRYRDCGIDFRTADAIHASADDRLWPPEED